MVADDLYYDCLDSAKSKTLTDICDIFDFTNLVKSAACFMKHCTPTLVDVFLTNKPNFCFNVLNFGCCVSDWHNLVGVVVKGATARVEKKRTKYRSYEKFDEQGSVRMSVGYHFRLHKVIRLQRSGIDTIKYHT